MSKDVSGYSIPHASRFGGVGGRQIGTIRYIVDAMLFELGLQELTDELLDSLVLEVAAIVNAHPITAIPAEINEPQPMSPAMLLTQMTCQLGIFLGSFSSQGLCDQTGWKRVQFLADQLLTRWRLDHIINLQARKKAGITLLAQRITMDPCFYSLFPRNLKHLQLLSATIAFRWCVNDCMQFCSLGGYFFR